VPSFASIFTGQLPSRHGAGGEESHAGQRIFDRLDPSVRTAAELLGEYGYATAALVNNPFLAPEFELDRGFDLYDYHGGTNAEIRRADVMFQRAVKWIDAHGEEPFFLVVHLFDPHMNYDAPIPFRGRFTDGIASQLALPVEQLNAIRAGTLTLNADDREFIAAAYDEEVAFVDEQLGRFLDALQSRGLFDRALVVLTADHGEELFEHDGFEHGHAQWQELLHVPLMVWGPGVLPGRETHPVSVIDILPTVLEFAGAASPEVLEGRRPEPFQGRSLWPNLRTAAPLPPRTLFAGSNFYGSELQVALRWPHKLIVNTADGDRWLFDLSANPEERFLSGSQDPVIIRELLSELIEQLQRGVQARDDAPAVEVDEETLQKLRALGYVQ
jgi:arylsulfatase A-like enzyme